MYLVDIKNYVLKANMDGNLQTKIYMISIAVTAMGQAW